MFKYAFDGLQIIAVRQLSINNWVYNPTQILETKITSNSFNGKNSFSDRIFLT